MEYLDGMNLSGMTIGKLKEIISDIDDNVEIGIWDNLGLITDVKIEITHSIFDEPDVCINIDGVYPYQKGDTLKRLFKSLFLYEHTFGHAGALFIALKHKSNVYSILLK